MRGHSYTYRQVKHLVQKIQCGLAAVGFMEGDVFAFFSPNCPEFALVLLGVVGRGGVVTTLNPLHTVGESDD